MTNLNIIFENQITFILITLLAAAMGGFIFIKLKIPAAPIIGAMFFSMIVSIFWGKCFIPKFLVIASRIIAGTLIGCRISHKSLLSMKKIFIPMLFFTFFILTLSMFSGYIIYSITGIHKATAFFGSAPGGLTDMSLISSEFNADMSIVALLQVVRMIACLTVVPFIAKRNGTKKLENQNMNNNEQNIYPDLQSCEEPSFNHFARFFTTILVGPLGGALGIILSIPAGALTGAFIFVVAFNIFFFKLYIPTKIRYGTQMLIGAVIGSGMTMNDLIGLKSIIVPALMVAVFLLTIGIFLGFMLNRIWKIDMITALIATAPGGLTGMSLIAPDLGVDVTFVTSLQFIRLVAIIMVYPIVMKLIL